MARTQAITFQIAVGAPSADNREDIVSRELDQRDVWAGSLFLGQLKGRTLSVASSRFAEQVTRRLAEQFGAA